jgi:hypothetical protein
MYLYEPDIIFLSLHLRLNDGSSIRRSEKKEQKIVAPAAINPLLFNFGVTPRGGRFSQGSTGRSSLDRLQSPTIDMLSLISSKEGGT